MAHAPRDRCQNSRSACRARGPITYTQGCETGVRSGVKQAGKLIREAVTSWPGVVAAAHRFGGTEYRYGRKEMGHVHGDRLADLPLPRKLRDEMIAAGRAQPHHVLPETGWVSCRMAGPEDADGVIELFRIQYERYSADRQRDLGAPA
jgi:Family of unknown function (DUF5519)